MKRNLIIIIFRNCGVVLNRELKVLFLVCLFFSTYTFSDEVVGEMPNYLVCTERSNMIRFYGSGDFNFKDPNSNIRGDIIAPPFGSRELEDCVNGLIEKGYEPYGDLIVEVVYEDIEKKKQVLFKGRYKKKFDMFILFYQPMLKKQIKND